MKNESPSEKEEVEGLGKTSRLWPETTNSTIQSRKRKDKDKDSNEPNVKQPKLNENITGKERSIDTGIRG